MPLTTTATTGQTSTADKTAIGYAVGHDIQETDDPQTTGYAVTLTVEGSDSPAFVYEMLGYGEVLNIGTPTAKLHRVLPEPCGRDSRAYCVKLESVMHAPDALTAGATTVNSVDWPTYQIESFRATYAIPLYDVLEDEDVTYEHERFCIWRSKITAQNEKIPGGGFQWVSGTAADRTKVPEVGVKTGRSMEMTCKWLDVPFVYYDIFSTLANCVNASDVTWNGITFTTETVLLTGVDAEPRINVTGNRTYDITFSFAVRTDGRTWNKFWKTGSAGYVEISSDGTTGGTKPFQTADLNLLWTFT